MMPCRPAMMFCSIVGQANVQTVGPIGPSTIDRSNFLNFPPGSATETAVYYAPPMPQACGTEASVRLANTGKMSLLRRPAMFRNPASLRPVVVAFIAALVLSGGAAAQTAWKQGRTPDGQPDLQGIWLNFDSTPFEAASAQPAAPAAAATAAAN